MIWIQVHGNQCYKKEVHSQYATVSCIVLIEQRKLREEEKRFLPPPLFSIHLDPRRSEDQISSISPTLHQ